MNALDLRVRNGRIFSAVLAVDDDDASSFDTDVR